MSKNDKKEEGITIKKEDDMPEWYQQVCLKAELADFAPVKGFMIIRPRGYALWENIQRQFDSQIKPIGVKNSYFPLLIPESFFKREAQHAKGFAPELAWIEKLDEQEERVAIRPTSETIMYDAYSHWVRSWRELPLRINQWCNVLRWEVKQTKLFLRTREFLWQEGHCVYATEQEVIKETQLYLNEYKKLIEGYLAIPVISGKKTSLETFAGANYTLTLEALMPDGKALQMSTSHNLGQNFAKVFQIEFVGEDEKKHYGWQNSWGFSTRLLGAIVMVHGDDKGLVMPPKIADEKIVIVPIYKEKDKKEVLKTANELKQQLAEYNPILDDRDEYTPGWKYNEWELKGIPLRIEIGPRDIEKKQVVVVRRDNFKKEFVKISELNKNIPVILENMQNDMFKKAKAFLDSHTTEAKNWKEFLKEVNNKNLVKVQWCGVETCEGLIKEKAAGVTSRCIVEEKAKGKCFNCNKEATCSVYFGKNY